MRRPLLSRIALPCVLTLVFVLVGPAAAASGPPGDYLFPPKDFAARPPAVRALPGRSVGDGLLVDYAAFDGRHHSLTMYQGRFVAILLPVTWTGERGLSPSQIRSFVERTDLLYAHFSDLEGREPAGTGLLNVAVLPEGQTCGWGCGWIGARGIEVADIDRLNPILWREIAHDMPVGVVAHEMTHNFDLYEPVLGYLPGHAHAWTDFVTFLIYDFSRAGQADDPPEEVVRAWLDKAYRPYASDPTSTWADCVRDGLCESRGITANNAWGTVGLRVTSLYGPRAARGFFHFLNDWMAHQSPPGTPEAKEDLHIEALSAGAGANLSCFADFWHWRLGTALRARLAALYGAANPLCEDADGDGVTPLAGDCDDGGRFIGPGAAERVNGIDDDCDAVVDEQTLSEPTADDFPSPRSVALPVEIVGRLEEGDADLFLPSVGPMARVRSRICSTGLQGAVVSHGPAANILTALFVAKGACESWVHELPEAGSSFDVELFYAPPLPGGYVLRLAAAEEWPAPWAALGAPEHRQGYWKLDATALDPTIAARADEVRFWVSGLGFVGTAPAAPTASLAWSAAGVAPGLYSYRAQLLEQGSPISDLTAPSPLFAVTSACEPSSEALCLNGSRFRVTAHWRTSTGAAGVARANGLTADTGWFWFFDAANVEVVLKVLNGCGVNDRYWVFASGLTDVEVVLEVLDTRTGQSRTYTSSQGRAFQPVQDTAAFAACP